MLVPLGKGLMKFDGGDVSHHLCYKQGFPSRRGRAWPVQQGEIAFKLVNKRIEPYERIRMRCWSRSRC